MRKLIKERMENKVVNFVGLNKVVSGIKWMNALVFIVLIYRARTVQIYALLFRGIFFFYFSNWGCFYKLVSN